MRSIVITGASSGIGAALARTAAARGWAVLLVARREDRLIALAREIEARGGRCATLRDDVTAPDAAQRIVHAALQAFERIDVVVNNAGNAKPGHLLDQSDAAIEAQWQLHVAGPLRIARAALPHVERVGGGLVFLGSGLARVPAPGYGAYAPAKAAVRAAAIQLRRELHARGVFVTYVDPGVVATEFSIASGMEHKPQSWHATPERVADAILRGIERRATRVNAVAWQTAGTVLGEWMPALADAAMQKLVVAPAPQPPDTHVSASQVANEPPTAPAAPSPSDEPGDPFDAALEPVRRRMERVKLPESFVRDLLAAGTTISLHDAAMRWAGMPNKNERAALHEVLAALAQAGFIASEGDETWRVLRAP
ncbi:MAG: SDR family NAD(P)-dependent oxidoreductase [bacterium]|nr:SDR family NAD(P)-dependent oxidoreductase [bacterium]